MPVPRRSTDLVGFQTGAYFVDTYEKYDRGGRPPRQKQVEAHLASVLKEKGVSVKCDTSIKYTIVR